MLSILTAFILFGLTFALSSCKACNKKSKDPENRTAVKSVEEPAKPDDKNTEADVVAEARRLALEARVEVKKVKLAAWKSPVAMKMPNWDTYMDMCDKKIREATQAAERVEALEAQAIEFEFAKESGSD